MYSILIVDDEPIIRKGISNFIDWESIDCKVIGEASNGIEAREMIQVNKPDIVISDIKMPGIDGIELSKFIYEEYPKTKIILLTGYSDFKYAQSALRYNVVDFILKPSNNEDIIAAVEKAKEIIYKAREKEKKILDLENQFIGNLTQLQDKFLYDFIKGIYKDKEVIEYNMKLLNIKLNNYYVLSFKINTKEQNNMIDVKENKKNILLEIKRFISLVFKEQEHYNVTISCNTICTVLNFPYDYEGNKLDIIFEKSRELINFFKSFMNISIYLGISSLQTEWINVSKAYEESIASLAQKFYDEKSIFAYSRKEYNNNISKETIEYSFVDKIINYIKVNDEEKAIVTLKELYDELKVSRQPISNIKNISILICSLIFKMTMKNYVELSTVVDDSSEIYEKIIKCDSINKLYETVESLIKAVLDNLDCSSSQDNYIIKKVTKYIEVNYKEQIKLSELANMVHVNSSYLSRLFKQETGYTLTELLTKIRIEKAKELLSLTNMRSYEIGIKVGIEDPAYFSQVFKKYTGVSPSEYKKTIEILDDFV